MKQSLLFLFVFAIIGSTSASDNDRLEFLVKEARRDTLHPDVARVTLELKNLTDDTLIFLTETPAVNSSLYSIEDTGKMLIIFPEGCRRFKIFLKVSPHSSYQENIAVGNCRYGSTFPVFRIRINLVEPKEKHNLLKADKEKNKKQFSIWTDYIQFK